MPYEILMPRLSDTMETGTIAKWLKQPGDAVKKGEALAEIETDKATMQLEAFRDGTLGRVILPDGQSAAIGTPIAELLLPGEEQGAGQAAAAPSPADGTRSSDATATAAPPPQPAAPQPTSPPPATPQPTPAPPAEGAPQSTVPPAEP